LGDRIGCLIKYFLAVLMAFFFYGGRITTHDGPCFERKRESAFSGCLRKRGERSVFTTRAVVSRFATDCSMRRLFSLSGNTRPYKLGLPPENPSGGLE